ncbi:MAG: hypothetical protein IKP88_04940 [Lachnospiraceae bacterium]|nr:hypothetical protein [Lachnospiraceae bacterium]
MKRLNKNVLKMTQRAFIAMLSILTIIAGMIWMPAAVSVKAYERQICYTTTDVVNRLNSMEALFKGKYWGAYNSSNKKTHNKLINAISAGYYDMSMNYTMSERESNLGLSTSKVRYSNEFKGGSQCHGFALMMMYILFNDFSLKANTNFIKYSGSDLDSLVLQPGDFIRESPHTVDGVTKQHSGIVWKVENGTVYIIESNVNSANKGSNWINYGVRGFRYSAKNLTTNEGITKYIKDAGGFVLRYRYISNTESTVTVPEPEPEPETPVYIAPVVNINLTAAPSQIKKGKCFNLKGTISCDTAIIREVTCYIKDSSSNIRDTTVDYPNSNSMSIVKANLNMYTDFNKLPVGNYTLQIIVKTDNGGYGEYTKAFSVVK